MDDVKTFQNPDPFGLKRQKLISEREAILEKLKLIETKLYDLKVKRGRIFLKLLNEFDKIKAQENISFTTYEEIKDINKKIEKEKDNINIFGNRKKIESLMDLTTQKIEENCKTEQQELRVFAELIEMFIHDGGRVNDEIKYLIAERNRIYNEFKRIDTAVNLPNLIFLTGML